ncbi:MAG TPA: hypothetical protein VFS00_02505, partial [Polyangiaceae bacterium]|nr:hypothetical protein [Polyangiaceae bacterium]
MTPSASLPGATPAHPHAGAAGAGAAASPLVRVRDRKVFHVLAARGGQSAEARARAASAVLEKAIEEKEGGD